MTAELARAGGPVAVAGLGLLILARPSSYRLAGLALWAIGTILLVPYLAPSGDRPLLVAAAVVGLAIAAALAALLRRWPWLFALLALGLTPARIPVSVGSTEANLLLPLYVVVVAGAFLLGWELWRDRDGRSRELGALAWPLAALVFWLGLSAAWTNDVREAAIEVLFFLSPFALLALVVARLPWRPRAVVSLYGLLAAMALLFALVGIGQWVAKDVFWNPKVMVGNDVEPFFRVNSLFWDPSIYGRFLVVALLATLVVIVLRTTSRRLELALGGGIAAVWVGLLFSYSQSSFVALVAGILVLGFVAWRARVLLAVAAAAVFLLTVGATGPAAAPALSLPLAAGVTDGRAKLVENGLRIAAGHPVVGVGLGGFKKAYAKRLDLKQRNPRKAASHTTPVTVAAETGFPGLLLYLWLVAVAVVTPFRRLRDGGTLQRATAWAAGLAVTAIAVHSLFYNAFFEDPMLWGSLGLAALALARRREEAP